MTREIQELLQELQKFTNLAVKHLQLGDNDRAKFFFNICASINGQIADKI